MAVPSVPASMTPTGSPPPAPTTSMPTPWSTYGTTDPSTLSGGRQGFGTPTGAAPAAPSAAMATPWSAFGTQRPMLGANPASAVAPTGAAPGSPSFSLGTPGASASMPGMSGAMSIPAVLQALGSKGGAGSM